MRYLIVDSHRNMTKKRRDALAKFFTVSKNLPIETAYEQVGFCDWYESEYAVKWFEVLALDGEFVVGYLRCLRNPDEVREWYIGDVYVYREFRKRRVALRMYEIVFKELLKYEAAERVIATVNIKNTASIGLHLKSGFHDTGKPVNFASFYADPDETVYLKRLFRPLPFPTEMTDEKIKDFMLDLWIKFRRANGLKGRKEAEKSLLDALWEARNNGMDFVAIWCGNRLVGFRYKGEDFVPELNEVD